MKAESAKIVGDGTRMGTKVFLIMDNEEEIEITNLIPMGSTIQWEMDSNREQAFIHLTLIGGKLEAVKEK